MKKIVTLVFLAFAGNIAVAQNDAVLATPLGAIIAPASGCVLTSAEPVTIRIFNSGPGTINSPFYVSFDITGPVASYAGEMLPGGVSIPPNSSYLYTFTATADLSVAGTYTMSDTVLVAGDPNAGNNTQSGYIIDLTPTSVGGTITGPSSVCTTGNSGFLTLGGNVGNVVSWGYSTDGGSLWNTISNTSTVQSYNNLTVPTKYRAIVKNGVCASVYSDTLSITIDAVSAGGTLSPATRTVCSGASSGLMTLTGKVGTVVKWQYSTDNWVTPVDTAVTSLTLTYPKIIASPTRFRVVVQNGACPTANSTVSTITASPPSVGGTVSGGTTVCSGSNSGSLTLAGHTGTIQWQISATRTFTSITNGSTTTTQTYSNLVATRYYRARLTSGTCAAVFSTVDSIVVNPAAVGGTLSSAATVCSGSTSGLLTLTGYTGTVSSWEVSINGGAYTTIANTLPTYTSGVLTSGAGVNRTYDYRVKVMNGPCGPATSSVIRIMVNPASVGGTTSPNATVCSGSNGGTITLSGHTGSITGWESSTNGTTWAPIVNTTATQTYTNLVNTTYYRAVVKSGVCASTTSSIDTITVNALTAAGSVTASSNVCYGTNSGILTLSGHSGNVVRWEYSIDGGVNWNPIANTTTTYNYTNITLTTIYRAIVQSGTCATAISGTATLTVDPVSVGGTISGSATACGGTNSGSLNLIGYVGTVQGWESSTDGGVSWTPIANTTATENYSNILTSTMYRAIVANGVCSNDTSATATITVDPPSVGGTLTSDTTVCALSNSGTLTLTGYSGTIQNWESSTDGGVTWQTLSNSTSSQSYLNLSVTTLYRVFVKSGVCNGANSNTVTITVDPAAVGGALTGAVAGCEGANGGTLTLGNYVGTIQNWESSIDAGATWTSIANTTAMQSYSNLTDTTWYRVIVKSGMCSADTSTVTTVIVYPKPVANYAADTVCFGSATTFVNTSSVKSGFIQFYQWGFGDNNTSLSANPTHTYATAGTFSSSLLLTTNFGCLDTATLNVLVNALPPSTITASGALAFCTGDSIILTAAAGDYRYVWSTAATTQNITVLTSGTYGLTISDTLTGCFASGSVMVTVHPSPTVFAGNDTTLSLGKSIQLNASGVGIISWSWLPVTGLNNTSISNPVANPVVTTTYKVTGSDANGCTGEDSVMITVIFDYNIVVSNLMTPNGDGYNDNWIIQNIENYPNTEVVVFNREGQELFKSESYNNEWDGTRSGKILPDGTYYYIIKFENSSKVYKGSITILKENGK